jgi:hypothetical protein
VTKGALRLVARNFDFCAPQCVKRNAFDLQSTDVRRQRVGNGSLAHMKMGQGAWWVLLINDCAKCTHPPPPKGDPPLPPLAARLPPPPPPPLPLLPPPPPPPTIFPPLTAGPEVSRVEAFFSLRPAAIAASRPPRSPIVGQARVTSANNRQDRSLERILTIDNLKRKEGKKRSSHARPELQRWPGQRTWWPADLLPICTTAM